MAEEAPVQPGGLRTVPAGRQIIIIATVVTVVFFTLLLLGLRSCSAPAEKGAEKTKLASHVVIYSNLSLKDSALVITRLKELKIPYQIKDEGRAIAVPRARADDARLGLAEKNLPAGGTVGWEIFDQARLGATDFDRRIQFIRAVSGELARTINRISAVEDARVQIVIPETRLFEVTKAPVTASVLLKLKPGETLSPQQVNGIVHLVAGSVENLNPENITIIDTNGIIMSAGGYAQVPEKAATAPKTEERTEEVVVEKTEEKAALEVQAKLELEDTLTGKVQSLLNKMYPPNITIARVNVDSIRARKITVIILVDKKYSVDQSLKKSTFDAISAAVGYDKKRGDRIIMKSVTFHAAVPSEVAQKTAEKKQVLSLDALKQVYRKLGRQSAIVIAVLFLVLLLMVFSLFRGGRTRSVEAKAPEVEEQETKEEEIPVISQMKSLAAQKPEQAAEIIKSWVAEEGG